MFHRILAPNPSTLMLFQHDCKLNIPVLYHVLLLCYIPIQDVITLFWRSHVFMCQTMLHLCHSSGLCLLPHKGMAPNFGGRIHHSFFTDWISSFHVYVLKKITSSCTSIYASGLNSLALGEELGINPGRGTVSHSLASGALSNMLKCKQA